MATNYDGEVIDIKPTIKKELPVDDKPSIERVEPGSSGTFLCVTKSEDDIPSMDGASGGAAHQCVREKEDKDPSTATTDGASGSASSSAAKKKGSGATSSRANWTLHAINVHQGDAFLIDLQCSDGATHKRYLVDSGIGHETQQKNLESCLKAQACLNTTGTKKRLELDAIILTHPDKDHIGGAKIIFEECDYDGKLVITEAFYEKLTKKETQILSHLFEALMRTFGEQDGTILPQKIKRYGPLHCHFSLDTMKGKVYAKQEAADKETNGACVHVKSEAKAGEKLPKDYVNESSILTTVNENTNGFDVVLTGDSKAHIIRPLLECEGDAKPHIKVFQVPHHGSDKNSNEKFYKSFTADIYLVSGGGNQKLDHPNRNVLMGIIKACVENQHKSKIVVTNSYGLRSEKVHVPGRDGVPEWRTFVTIHHLDDLFSRHAVPYLTVKCDGHRLPSLHNVICWSPEGYITQIRESQEFLKSKKVRIFRKDTQATVTSCSGELTVEITTKKSQKEFTILLVPDPGKPWTDKEPRKINPVFVIKESISDNFRCTFFLEMEEESKALEIKVYRIYKFEDNYFECKSYESQSTRKKIPQGFTLKSQPEFTFSNNLYE